MYLHIIPRSVAKIRGFKRFYTGFPCKYGHLSERVTSSSTCLICDAERKKAYRKENPEKAKECLKASRIKHSERRKLDNKIWRERNSDSLRESKKQYVENNRAKVKAAKQKYYEDNKERCLAKSKEHKAANAERYRNLNRIWRENNKQSIRTLNRNRKKKIKMADGKHTVKDVLSIFSMQKGKCAACACSIKNENYHVDHIQPLALGGSNWPSNLQLLCPTCNMSKGAKKPEDFYAGLGYLL